jgi:hypothetical protein
MRSQEHCARDGGARFFSPGTDRFGRKLIAGEAESEACALAYKRLASDPEQALQWPRSTRKLRIKWLEQQMEAERKAMEARG